MSYKIIIENKEEFFSDSVRTQHYGGDVIFTAGGLERLLNTITRNPDKWRVSILERTQHKNLSGKTVLNQQQTTIF